MFSLYELKHSKLAEAVCPLPLDIVKKSYELILDIVDCEGVKCVDQQYFVVERSTTL